MADDEEEYEDEYTDGSFEDEVGDDIDNDFIDEDFGDEDEFGDEDGGDGWDDDDVDVTDQQYVIPIEDKPGDDSDEYTLDKDGNIVSPKENLKRQKSIDIQCWTCSNCKATNKLSWTLTKFAMKCCMCKQDTYTPTVKIFDSNNWDEPSNDFWECSKCTLHNPIGSNECGACQENNLEYVNQSDDDTYGNNEFIKEETSDDDNDMSGMGGMGHHGMHGGMGHHGMHSGMHGMDNMLAGIFGGMGGMGRMGGPMMGGGMRGQRGHGGGMRRQRQRNRDTKPYNKEKENNLRNLLIIGFIRSCNGLLLPTKFFKYFNKYYKDVFDHWDWDLFRESWTSKKNDMITIKRCNKDKSIWKNMYGRNSISYNIKTDKYPRKYKWTLRLLDRKQIDLEQETIKNENANENMDIEEEEDKKQQAKKLESFEIQYIDVMIGVVNTDKMSNQQLLRAFNMYSCGHGLFAGNGKIYKGRDTEWIRAMKPLKHKDYITINIEWMERKQFNILYSMNNNNNNNNNNNDDDDDDDDDIVVALTFNKNNEIDIPKGAAYCLPSSAQYKLAVSSAKKRFEIEWISSGWVTQNIQSNDGKEMDIDYDVDDIKDDIN